MLATPLPASLACSATPTPSAYGDALQAAPAQVASLAGAVLSTSSRMDGDWPRFPKASTATAVTETLPSGVPLVSHVVDADSPVCVLGQTVVDNLFGNEDPVGKVIRLKTLPCKVVGVLVAKGPSATGQDQDDFVVMPLTTAQKRITGNFWLDDIFCSAVSREAMPEATRQIVSLLRERHHLNPGEDDDFNVRRPEDAIQAQLAASRIMTLLLASIASLSLLVGGIGIMNIMLVSVTQRTREIGIRLAVGATDWDVQMQFLSEAVALSSMGGILGVLVGVGSAALVENLFHFPTQLTTGTFLTGAMFSAGMGILFGYYPARRASQLDPIQGLRYE